MKPLAMIPEPPPPVPESTRTEFAADADRTAALKPAIIDAISTVFDPEIPVNIWELGLIYDVAVDASGTRARHDDADGSGLSRRTVAAFRGRIKGESGCRRRGREG